MKISAMLLLKRAWLGILGFLIISFWIFPQTVYGQMTVPAKCPDIVGGVDYCPTISNATRCSVYGTSPSCAAKANELQTPSNTSLNCDNCTFSCQSGWADCSGGIGEGSNGCETQSQIGQSCTTTDGQSGTYTGNACSPTCTAAPAYVSRQFSDPGTVESGFFYIVGNMKSSAGDLYLANNKAIRVDGSGGTTFNIGNWGTGADSFKMNIYGDLSIYSALSVTGETTLKNDVTVQGQMNIKTSIGTNLKIETTSNSITTASQLSLYHGGNNDWAIKNLNGVLQMYDLTSNAERLRINQSGFVTIPGSAQIDGMLGIGVAPTTKKLDVVGQINASQGLCINNVCKTSWDQVGGGAGGTTGDLLSVLNTGADASAFVGDTKIGGNVIVGVGNDATSAKLVVESDIGTGGDFYLGNNKAVRVDGSGMTNLNIGNWGTGANGIVTSIWGNLTVSGCFGPVFVGMTGGAVNGNQAGYNSADSLCASAVSGSHICTTSEILNSKSCKATAFVTQSSGDAWVLNGPPGFTANANDCIGRTSASSGDFGSFWLFNSQGGQGWLSPCNQTHQFACCK